MRESLIGTLESTSLAAELALGKAQHRGLHRGPKLSQRRQCELGGARLPQMRPTP